MKCSIVLGDTVTARQANQKAGSPQDQDLKNLEALERFKEETMNALNNKDYRRVSCVFLHLYRVRIRVDISSLYTVYYADLSSNVNILV